MLNCDCRCLDRHVRTIVRMSTVVATNPDVSGLATSRRGLVNLKAQINMFLS